CVEPASAQELGTGHQSRSHSDASYFDLRRCRTRWPIFRCLDARAFPKSRTTLAARLGFFFLCHRHDDLWRRHCQSRHFTPSFSVAVAIGVEAIGFAMMAALGVSWLVVIGCGIAGLAGGMLSPLQMVLITEETPEHMRGRAFSLFTAIMQFGGPIGLVIASGL